MICAGDEAGLEGAWAEDGRRTIPWQRPELWNSPLEDGYRRLIALRRRSPALTRGGLRFAHADADTLAYVRELPGERILMLASRADHAPIRIPLALLDARELHTLHGEDAQLTCDDAVLPASGPAFHAWQLIDTWK
jgi:alpha-glucosidase